MLKNDDDYNEDYGYANPDEYYHGEGDYDNQAQDYANYPAEGYSNPEEYQYQDYEYQDPNNRLSPQGNEFYEDLAQDRHDQMGGVPYQQYYANGDVAQYPSSYYKAHHATPQNPYFYSYPPQPAAHSVPRYANRDQGRPADGYHSLSSVYDASGGNSRFVPSTPFLRAPVSKTSSDKNSNHEKSSKKKDTLEKKEKHHHKSKKSKKHGHSKKKTNDADKKRRNKKADALLNQVIPSYPPNCVPGAWQPQQMVDGRINAGVPIPQGVRPVMPRGVLNPMIPCGKAAMAQTPQNMTLPPPAPYSPFYSSTPVPVGMPPHNMFSGFPPTCIHPPEAFALNPSPFPPECFTTPQYPVFPMKLPYPGVPHPSMQVTVRPKNIFRTMIPRMEIVQPSVTSLEIVHPSVSLVQRTAESTHAHLHPLAHSTIALPPTLSHTFPETPQQVIHPSIPQEALPHVNIATKQMFSPTPPMLQSVSPKGFPLLQRNLSFSIPNTQRAMSPTTLASHHVAEAVVEAPQQMISSGNASERVIVRPQMTLQQPTMARGTSAMQHVVHQVEDASHGIQHITPPHTAICDGNAFMPQTPSVQSQAVKSVVQSPVAPPPRPLGPSLISPHHTAMEQKMFAAQSPVRPATATMPRIQPTLAMMPPVQPPLMTTPTVHAPVMTTPTVHAPVMTTPTVHPPLMTTPTVHPPLMTTPTVHAPVMTTPTVHAPLMTTPTVHAPVMTTPTVHAPLMTTPTVHAPLMTTPTVHAPLMTTPTVHAPVMTTPTVHAPVMTTPTVQPPVMTTPTVQPPLMTTPSVQPPLMTTPTVQPPLVTTPTVQPPLMTTPTVQPPLMTTPVQPPLMATPTVHPPLVTTPTVQPSLMTTPTVQPPMVTTPNTQQPLVAVPNVQAPMVTTPRTQPGLVMTPGAQPSQLTTPSVQATRLSTPVTQTRTVPSPFVLLPKSPSNAVICGPTTMVGPAFPQQLAIQSVYGSRSQPTTVRAAPRMSTSGATNHFVMEGRESLLTDKTVHGNKMCDNNVVVSEQTPRESIRVYENNGVSCGNGNVSPRFPSNRMMCVSKCSPHTPRVKKVMSPQTMELSPRINDVYVKEVHEPGRNQHVVKVVPSNQIISNQNNAFRRTFSTKCVSRTYKKPIPGVYVVQTETPLGRIPYDARSDNEEYVIRKCTSPKSYAVDCVHMGFTDCSSESSPEVPRTLRREQEMAPLTTRRNSRPRGQRPPITQIVVRDELADNDKRDRILMCNTLDSLNTCEPAFDMVLPPPPKQKIQTQRIHGACIPKNVGHESLQAEDPGMPPEKESNGQKTSERRVSNLMENGQDLQGAMTVGSMADYMRDKNLRLKREVGALRRALNRGVEMDYEMSSLTIEEQNALLQNQMRNLAKAIHDFTERLPENDKSGKLIEELAYQFNTSLDDLKRLYVMLGEKQHEFDQKEQHSPIGIAYPAACSGMCVLNPRDGRDGGENHFRMEANYPTGMMPNQGVQIGPDRYRSPLEADDLGHEMALIDDLLGQSQRILAEVRYPLYQRL